MTRKISDGIVQEMRMLPNGSLAGSSILTDDDRQTCLSPFGSDIMQMQLNVSISSTSSSVHFAMLLHPSDSCQFYEVFAKFSRCFLSETGACIYEPCELVNVYGNFGGLGRSACRFKCYETSEVVVKRNILSSQGSASVGICEVAAFAA